MIVSPNYKNGCEGGGRSKCLETVATIKVQDVVETMMNNNLTNSTVYTEVLE